MRVYVAAPYTQGDPVRNVRRVIDAGDALLAAGHSPFLPHLNMLWHIVSPKQTAEWYELDLAWLEVADAVLVLEGPSEGVDAEVLHARRRGILVVMVCGSLEYAIARLGLHETRTRNKRLLAEADALAATPDPLRAAASLDCQPKSKDDAVLVSINWRDGVLRALSLPVGTVPPLA